MRRLTLAVSALTLAAYAVPAAACDGKAEVQAAFVKQQKQPWRTEVQTPTQDGEIQHQQFDFQPPDKMYRKAVVAGQSIETIGISKWAWSSSGGGWEELQPMHARGVTLQVEQAFMPPQVTGDFQCLGKVTFEGKSYLGYQTAPEKVETGQVLARTIYVDPETGLPAFNIVGAPGGNGEFVVKGAFSYPTDIDIKSPF